MALAEKKISFDRPVDRASSPVRIELSPAQLAFVSARVRNPPKPSERLRAAMKRSAK